MKDILKWSNPNIVSKKAKQYLGNNVVLKLSTLKNKKYMIYDIHKNKWVHFGQIGYEDYTKHKNKTRRHNYLTRSNRIRGDWRKNKYSPNNLSIHILW